MVLKETFVRNVQNVRGVKILVTRYWPRGVKKEKFDHWFRDLAPSVQLLRDWKNETITWKEYERRYKHEILKNPKAIEKMVEIRDLSEKEDVYLICHETEFPCHRYILMTLIQSHS